jgi:acyl carrier protein
MPAYRGSTRMTQQGQTDVSDRIKQIIYEHGRLPTDVRSLDEDADLYQAGMTSHASVNLMLALEAAFDIEFPDAMLKRSVFQSVASISKALGELGAATA